ncbi:tRNA lysidine(34) synthetase TilS [Roseococcus sp. SYP-B2431]|uniref:tRNA lysidine(34) synthetase TilS n=1 Tax=Roseococcus sp. SYP-B2431 TaxID=2496640 RepID=UPI00103D530D|nr:tRNA lysidine(34) synthetase TilS [Roseococcus sp. SYP-B2431]TCH97810.1 tRNA lysidine(34) synthetase TilS [Roseococcus sp. SYP-B2431]
MTGALPVAGAEFAALMAPLGPFTDLIAVGCSGGPDSLALTRLADGWARGRGGSVLALIVEHGLRAESAAEAAALAAGLAALGITARILPLGLPSGPGLQERARRARRAALLAACREAGAPHLLLGHHAEDQAETVLFRALRGSGDAGLAGMAPLAVAPEALILRPLLAIPRARLAASLEGWPLRPVQDPSNADPRFARARLRAAGGTVAAGGFSRRRARMAARVAARLAASVRLLPEGCAEIAPERLGRDAVARQLMAALIRAVGGGEHAPAASAVAALLARGSGSLGGATWLRGGRWLVPEAGAGLRRFRFAVPEGFAAGPLGPDLAALRSRARHLPAAALAALPTLRRSADGMLVPPPHLAYLLPEMAVSFPPAFAPIFVPLGGPVTECHFAG